MRLKKNLVPPHLTEKALNLFSYPFNLFLTAVCLTAGVPEAAAQTASTIVYEDALWQRVHAADCPTLILKDLKQTMTLGQADQLGYRLGESGQSGRTDCCLNGYVRQYPAAVTANSDMGVAEIRPGDVLKYHVHGCHRFTPAREDLRMTLGEVMATPGNYHCEHCIERGTGVAAMTQEEWDKLPSDAPWVPPIGWAATSFPVDAYPDQEEINILLSQSMHGGPGIQERTFIDPIATVDNFMIMRFFFPVHRWLDLYMSYRVTGDTDILEEMRVSARNYNTLSKNYLSAAQKKAKDPEGMAYMYTMAASAKITLQLARKYPSQVTAGELAEAEDFLMTIISVLQPTCEGSSNLDSQMGIPQPLADDFRNRAFNRALNGMGTIGMTITALEDLQVLNSTTAYQPQIDRYRKIIQEYIINWKNTGWQETVDGKDYFTYPYSAGDNGFWQNGVKLFSVDDQGHFSHSMQGCYLLFESVPELGVDDAFMTAIANTVEFNSYTNSGSPQTPSQEAERPGYSRKPFGLPTNRFYLLNAFNSGVIDGQCSKLSALSKESTNSQYGYRLATFNAFYLKELRQDPTLIHMGEDSVAPPAPPTGLAGTGSDGSVSLNWDDNTESDMGSGTYTVYRSTTSGSGYTEIATGLSTSAYVDNGVVNDTLYFYVVTATDTNSDVSTYSAEAAAAPFVANGTPPATPTSLSASATEGSVSLDWADNGETDFNSYTVYRSTTSGSYGAALVTGVIPSAYVDTNVVNGTTYYYVVTALDHSGNASAQSSEISATPAAYGPTITFGTNNDGDGGFISSGVNGTEAWSLTADSVNYAFGLPATDESHTASLFKSYDVNRTEGSSYTFEGVVDLTAGYGDDNNRIGVVLFNPSPTQTGDGGGLYFRLNADGKELAIKNGLNGTTFASTLASGSYSGDTWIGTTLTFRVDLVFSNVGGTDKIDLTFTFTDQNNTTDILTAQVDAAGYTGTYCGFLHKWRQRGVDPTQNAPPVFDYRSFTFIDNTVDTTPPAIPTSLVATAGDDFVSLNWADNSEGDLASYSVYRSNVSGSYSGVLATGLFSSSYVDENAVNGNTYYYVVTATDTYGNESAQSSEVSATPEVANNPPAFGTNPVVEAGATEAIAYSSSIADNASDTESDPMTFSKVSGPTWLTVASNGAVSGTPGSGDAGLNSWTVRVADAWGSTTATLQITVVGETIPPDAPTGLAATPGDGWVSLDWADNTEGDLASYNIYRSTTSGSGFSLIGNSGSTSAYTDNTANNDTTYFYRVTALDNNGNESTESGEVSATPADVTAPAVPTGLTATPGDGSVTLDWNNNGEGDLASYTVYRSTTSNSYDAALATGVGGNTYTDNSVSNGTDYFYVVTAVDTSDNASLQSAEASAVPNALPAFTSDPVVETHATEDAAYVSSLADNASDSDGDSITFSKISGPAWLTVASNGALSGTPGAGNTGLNTWTVEVTDIHGGSRQAQLQITVDLETIPPAKPTGLGAVAGDGTVDLDWSNNSESDLASYTVYRSTTAGSGYTAIATGLGTSLYSDTSVTNDITYYYVVTALDNNGNESAQSDEASAMPQDLTAPAAPTGLTATAGDSLVTLNWNANGEGDLASYTVYRSTTAGSYGSALATGIGPSTYTDNSAGNGTTYYYVVTEVDTSGNESPVSSEASALPGILIQYPLSGNQTLGSSTGALTTVQDSNNGYQTLTEAFDGGGKRSTRQSYLEYEWTFDVATGTEITFLVEAHHTTNTEGDDFIFAYSTDGNTYTDMVTVTKTSDNDGLQAFTMPANTSGTVYVRVLDTDRSGGNDSPDTLYVDYLGIETLLADASPPNQNPAFSTDPVVEVNADEAQAYSSSLADNASDGDGDGLAFSKISGPAWLTVASNGALSGTPGSGDVGLNSWTVEVDDSNGGTDQATLEITVNVETIPPAVPTGLVAVAGDGSVSLNWDNNGEPDLASYSVYRSTTPGGGYSSIATGLLTSDYSDTSVTNGTTYYYVVAAVDDNSNESTQSGPASTTPSDTTAPATPTGLVAYAGDGSVGLEWNDNGESDLNSYTVYRSTTSGSGYSQIGTGVATSSYVDTSANNGTTYFYVVTAVDTVSNESAQSSQATASPSGDLTTRYEAEDALLSGTLIDSTNAGFSGTGYADYVNPSNDYVEWTVYVTDAGDVNLVFGYALGNTDRPLEIQVNGVVIAASQSFPGTGSWSTYGTTAALSASLVSGWNTVRATATGTSGGNLDYLDVIRDGDTDNDGMDDSWEISNFGDISSKDGTADSDGDGATDLHEFQSRTNPANSASIFALTTLTPEGTVDTWTVKWTGATGVTYRVLSAPSLNGPWTTEQSGLTGGLNNSVNLSSSVSPVFIKVEQE